MRIKGIVKKDQKTKRLIYKLRPGDIALLCHEDIDEIAAEALIKSKVKCIINTEKTITGYYPNKGPLKLLKSRIPIYETDDRSIFNLVKNGEIIEIEDNKVFYLNECIGKCRLIEEDEILSLYNLGCKNFDTKLNDFIDNTIFYIKKEKNWIVNKVDLPKVETLIKNRHVLIVVRGNGYKEDLRAIFDYIKSKKPVLIGVDGGGDALLEFGLVPDIVIGDLDSVSDRCLQLCKEIIVHAYPNGYAPGMARVKDKGLEAKIFSSIGTSEDIAMLLAYNYGAELIVSVGTHNCMIDFLEKGRKGMSSTFLVRTKIGSKLVDAKGINKLYDEKLSIKYYIYLGLSALLPIYILSMLSLPIKLMLNQISIRIKMLIGL
ncbi:thiamin pyrophosphokinase [Caloranaerobacter sp. TR13]|uniref:putative cytokinetic ring protein SteA n=1 Tax=Caloranaerobacter sp. TR13 TaxID=1302151 RepID=UPI0006D477CD|nr:putative cytokinetic ring protein SteA [Caloranaerobacter sp. TR13]KPU28102.1 thiamin pyrophosphokinase [Caloranaerobacter sp. TR13]